MFPLDPRSANQQQRNRPNSTMQGRPLNAHRDLVKEIRYANKIDCS